MNANSRIVLAFLTSAVLCLQVAPFTARADDVPGALSVEWEGKKPCEKLFEDDEIRVARCTFPEGTVHVCHARPSYLTYDLSGGLAEVQHDKGKRKIEVVAGAFANVSPIPWHEIADIGETTLQYLLIEKKYQPAPAASQTACPPRSKP
jgi:quercetin dioxygenase-like cupin family protein